MKARTDTKEKIVELGTDLFQTIGYPSLSYQQISSKLGIKNAAVHYHYPNKEDLGLDIINKELSNLKKFIAATSEMDQWEKLDALLTNYSGYLENGNRICVIGSSASNYAQLPETIQQASADYLMSLKQWFTDLLETGRNEGIFHFNGEPENKASLIVSALAGALQHARLVGNDHYYTVLSQVKLELKK